MQFYASQAAEAAALRRAVARSGCGVRSLSVTPGRVASDLACVDGWAAARLLLALAIEDAQTPGARKLAAMLRARAPSDEGFARAVHAFVLGRVRFEREEGELFQSGAWTLNHGYGDCDDHFRLIYAVAVAGGLPAALALLHHGREPDEGPAHATACVELDGTWTWLETTVAARFGEPPNDAAARLGLTDERTDIASEVVIMTEADLPPVPPGFRERNAPDRVTLDARALQRLGYLGSDTPECLLGDPTAPALRRAVLAFQRDQGLTPDGLLGDQETRPALARALRSIGEVGELGASPGIFTHAEAREVLRAAYVDLFKHEPTSGELDFGLATAYFETFYGRGGAAGWANRGQFGRWSAEGKFNWGALQSGTPGDENTLKAFVAAGLHPIKERGSDAARAVYFYLFPNDLEAAKAFLMSWGKADTLAAAATGSAVNVSAAMKRHGYYEGFHVGPGGMTPAKIAANQKGARFVEEVSDAVALQKNIAEYAAALSRHVATVRGSGGVDDTARHIGTAAVLAWVGFGLAAAGTAYAWWYVT